MHRGTWANGGGAVSLTVVGVVESPFPSKFAVPRQSGFSERVTSFIRIEPDWRDALHGLDGISHLWVLFQFHQVGSARAATRARPPRLGGNRRLGVFATRATHRPNGIGLSVVRIASLEPAGVHVCGLDAVDGTPVLDLKPYLPWADAPAGAHNAVSPAPPDTRRVRFVDDALDRLHRLDPVAAAGRRALLEDVLRFEARPAYQRQAERVYATEIAGLRVRWRYPEAGVVEVVAIEAADPRTASV